MNPALIAALIQQLAFPEILSWLKSLQQTGQPIDDAAIIAKLNLDADTGIKNAQDWLDSHPA